MRRHCGIAALRHSQQAAESMLSEADPTPRVARHVRAPRLRLTHPNPDAGTPRDRRRMPSRAGPLDAQRSLAKRDAILCTGNPQRTRQVARTATQLRVPARPHGGGGGRPRFPSSGPRGRRTSLPHQVESLHGRERADQHRRGEPRRLGDRVDQPVHPVVEVHVRETWRSVEGLVARRRAGGRMARRIVLADVGLHLDDHPGRPAFGCVVDQHHADQIASHVERRPGEE